MKVLVEMKDGKKVDTIPPLAINPTLDPNGGLTENANGLAVNPNNVADIIPKATTEQYGLVKVAENGGLIQNENGLAVKPQVEEINVPVTGIDTSKVTVLRMVYTKIGRMVFVEILDLRFVEGFTGTEIQKFITDVTNLPVPRTWVRYNLKSRDTQGTIYLYNADITGNKTWDLTNIETSELNKRFYGQFFYVTD